MMQEIFTEYGLPGDLVYLAMIESGFNQKGMLTIACGGSLAVYGPHRQAIWHASHPLSG